MSAYLSQCIAEQRLELEKLMLTNEDSPLNSPTRIARCAVSSKKSIQSSTPGSYGASSVVLFDSMARKHTEDEPSALPAPPLPYHAKHSKLPAFSGDRDNREDMSVDYSRGYTANSEDRLLSTAAQASKPYKAQQRSQSPPPHKHISAFSASLDVRQSTSSSAAASSADDAVGSAYLSALRQGAGGCTNNSSSSKCDSPKQALRSANGNSFAPAGFSDAASTGSHKGPAWEPASLNNNNKKQQQQLHASGDTRNGLNLYGGSGSSSKDNFGLPGRYSSAGGAAAAVASPQRQQQQQQQYESYTDSDHNYQHELDGHDSVQYTSSPRKQQQQQQTVGYMNGHSSSSKASEAEQEAHRNR
jgi:hypothetical protein